MAKRRKKWTVSRVMAALLGFVCALLLGVLFYGSMVHQLAGQKPAAEEGKQGGVLTLAVEELVSETVAVERVGGADCRVTTRVYRLPDGQMAKAITSEGASYLERLSQEGVHMQLITGFVVDDLEAVYALRGETGILAARQEDWVYMIEADIDQDTLYALGAGARKD